MSFLFTRDKGSQGESQMCFGNIRGRLGRGGSVSLNSTKDEVPFDPLRLFYLAAFIFLPLSDNRDDGGHSNCNEI